MRASCCSRRWRWSRASPASAPGQPPRGRLPAAGADGPRPRSLTWATNLDALGRGSQVAPRDGYLLVRSPQRPDFWWGNLLIFQRPPRRGEREHWEQLFEREFAGDPEVRHRTFAWDTTDGDPGAAFEEFAAHGYDLERTVGLLASVEELRPHARENRAVSVRRLDPRRGREQELWQGALAVSIAEHVGGVSREARRRHRQARLDELRERFLECGGGWYVATEPSAGKVVAACGLIRAGERLSIQDVDTLASYRRRGICSRLLVEAVHELAAREGAPSYVLIGADPDYHAIGIYESLGFRPRERCAGVCRVPDELAAGG